MQHNTVERSGIDAQVPDHLFIGEASAYSGMSIRTLRRWIATGKLAGYRRGGNRVVVKTADLDQIDTRIPTMTSASAGV